MWLSAAKREMCIVNLTAKLHPSAEIHPSSIIGENTTIWHNVQIMADVLIGKNCTFGKGVFIGMGTQIGDTVKVGNYSNLFGALVENEVFISPMVAILEDKYPRSTNLDGSKKDHEDFQKSPAIIMHGASLGTGSIILPGVRVGRYAMVSSGAVVYKNVVDHALVVGNPGRQIGYVCHCGIRLDSQYLCPCGRQYMHDGESLVYLQ